MSNYEQEIQALSPEKRALLELLLAEEASGPQTFPLSYGQQRLWFLDQFEPHSALYNIPVVVRLTGELNVAALTQALTALTARHEVLRTRFAEQDGAPVQVIAAAAPVELPVVDLADWPAPQRFAEAQRLAQVQAEEPFDLSATAPWRVQLVRLSATEHVLTLVLHHIITDGWSSALLVRELGQLYAAARTGQTANLPELPIQYADYAQWQRDWLSGPVLAEQVNYWRQQLAGAPPVLQLPQERPRSAQPSQAGATESFALDESVVAGLRALSREAGTTLFMTLLAGFKALLLRYTGQTDLVVGTPIANRRRAELEGLIGFFSNTLVLRTDASGDPSFRELLQRVRTTALAAYAQQDLPFEKLVEELQPERSLQWSPLFQLCFVFQSADALPAAIAGADELRIEPLAVDTGTAKFDLTLTLVETPTACQGQLQYRTELYDAAAMRRLTQHFANLLASAVAQPDAPLSTLAWLDAAERAALLAQAQPAPASYAPSACLHELFAAQAARTPNAVALSFAEQHWTYSALNQRANQLAQRLRALGVGPETRVGLYLERGPELVLALLGVLKAGGAYVPLDPVYPPQRLAYLLADSGVAAVLSESALAANLPAQAAPVLCLDTEDLTHEPTTEPVNTSDPAQAAYIIYTSGSTGQPKGVVVTHHNVVRLFQSSAREFDFNERDVWTLFHSYAFDFSVWEIWGALLHGGRLVVVPYFDSRAPEAFYDLLRREGVTVLNQTPSAFRQLQAVATATQAQPLALRYVIFGGEALDVPSLRPWVEQFGDEQPQLVNMYGITETTVHVTFRRIHAADVRAGAGSVIGAALADLQLHALDQQLEPVPEFVAGELCVGGAGLARGYWQRPALTAERFVPDPFSATPGARLYRAGDLARRLPAGELEYLGRQDHQVKLRGFRIELGEIEAALRAHPAIREAAVIIRESGRESSREPGQAVAGEARLLGYLVATPEAAAALPGAEALRSFLKERLPDYMVPAALLWLPALPLTAHGKLDRAALPEPGPERPDLAAVYVAPQTPTESALAEIWADVLKLAQVGVTDGFFALGGDSIRSVRVLALAKERGLNFSLQQLFQHQTIRELAAVVQQNAPTREASVHTEPFSLVSDDDLAKLPVEIEDAYPLTMLQAGMLYHMALRPAEAAYHNVNSIQLRTPFDATLFEAAVARAVARHAVLRTSFDLTTYREPLQLVHATAHLPIGVEDLRHLTPEECDAAVTAYVEREAQRPFELTQPPLLRLHLQRRTDDEFYLTLTECHAIFDGWSLHATLSEIFRTYAALLHGLEPETTSPAKLEAELSFRDFVALERQTLASPEAQAFWQEQLRDCTATLLPDWSQPTAPPVAPADTRRRRQSVVLPPPVAAGLNRLAQELGVPLKSVLLAAHLKVMSLVTGQHDVVTGLTTHGRPEESGGTEVRGLFLNSMPLRLALTGGTWAELVRRTFDAERACLPFRRFPLAALQNSLGVETLFDTLFNYVHFHVVDGVLQSGEVEVLSFKKAEATSFKLLVGCGPHLFKAGIDMGLEYDPTAIPPAQAARLAGYYERVLAALATQPQAHHEAQSFLADDERRLLFDEWNDTVAAYPTGACLHELVAAQAQRTPHAVALVAGEQRLSYAELEAQANQWAHFLRAQGVGPERTVGVCLERQAELVPVLLGVLKAGGAYVPLDPAYPAARREFMLRDSGAAVLLTQQHLQSSLTAEHCRVLCLENVRAEVAQQPRTAPFSGVQPDNLAYVIYTSGSTGTPKGVAIAHRSAVTLLHWARELFGREALAGMLFSTSICFDLSIFELFAPLSSGGKVILATTALHLPGLPAAAEVTFVNTVPSALTALLRTSGLPATVETVGLAGEPLPRSLAEQLYTTTPVRELWNLYGPTEDTTYSTYSLVPRAGEPTIGRPLANSQVYLLDVHGQPVPPGVPGELYLGGAGLARGYLHRPALTAERFVPDPFNATPGARLYRTGDLARYRADGELEYLGRLDQQVKLRGFRIELGEIEAALRTHPDIREAAAAVQTNAGQTGAGQAEPRLVGYVVPRAEAVSTTQDWRAYLRERLPEYLVPNVFVTLAALPLTPNGKLDRRALPAPETERPALTVSFVAPESELEQTLAQIWREVLRVEQVGIHDNFFDLGGHSLQLVQAHAKLCAHLGRQIPMLELFQYPTIQQIAQRLSQPETTAAAANLQPGTERAARRLAATRRSREV